MNLKEAKQNFRIQTWVVLISIILFVFKMLAYYLTHSVSVLTDALESTVNVTASFIGLYSLYISSKPRDEDHPYGHGKIEFISSAIEGTLIFVAGVMILYKSVEYLIVPRTIHDLDYGLIIVAVTALINFLLGYICIKIGTKNNSLALQSSGKHLQSDTWSTLGILVGLIIVKLTQVVWVDNVVAIIFGLFILYTGYTILRDSIAGIMDEADLNLLNQVSEILQKNRNPNWIDVHNLRVIKYGPVLHIDCHLTVPWFLNVLESHNEIDNLEKVFKESFGENVEMFVHVDGCQEYSCSLCTQQNCLYRKNTFVNRWDWKVENLVKNAKHNIDSKQN